LTAYDIFPEDLARTPDSGCLSSAAGATAERGQLLLDAITGSIAHVLRGELTQPSVLR